MPERLRCPVDAYMLLERDARVLMLRRAPDAAYAPSPLCPTGVRAGSLEAAC